MRLIIALVAVAFATATAGVYPAVAAAGCGNFKGYSDWAQDAFCGTGQRGG